ncbi:MAG: phosphoenolpyruvate carboxykinase, partial [Clostridia bacterium]|nr:phosphoenolpyruvate carboxykinase [Clostridia bacterium]
MTENKFVTDWLEKMKALCKPDTVVWIDGSEEQLEALRAEAVESGEMIKLNQEKLPGCYYHRTAENDVARVEDRTFICTPTEEEAGPINNWMAPDEMYAKLNALYDGSMVGRTMYVIPYSMGPVGSPFSKIGIELTDSIYVVLNMAIMTRIGDKVLEKIEGDEFIKCLHAKKDVNPDERYIVHFPQDNT